MAFEAPSSGLVMQLFYAEIVLPSLSVNLPTIIIMRSMSNQMPKPPKVMICRIAVPTFPA